VLENQLFKITGLENHRELVEAPNPACELDASDKVNRDIDAIAADVV
jgi:hypothetical protein